MERFPRLFSLVQDVSRRKLSLYAANASFFLLLSLLPLSLLALTALQYVPVDREALFSLLEALVPQALMPLFRDLAADIAPTPSGLLLSVSAVVTLWSASKGMLGLLEGLNAVDDAGDQRPYLKKRLLCMGYTLAMLLALVLTLVLQVFGARILACLSHLGLSRLLGLLLGRLRLYATALLALFFAALYLALPAKRKRLAHVWPGALAAAGAWTLFSAIFSYYVNHITNYPALYGSLGTLLLAVLWLYFCISILFYGAYLNRLLFGKKRL